jgi:hypothetical protein
MPALLLVDLLGARDLWREGADAADAAFTHFHRLVHEVARTLEAGPELTGELEASRAAMLCPTMEAAVALGRRVFRRAFLDARTPDDPRPWLRGVIVPADMHDPLRRATRSTSLPGLERHVYGPALCTGLEVLESGFAGMRLLVADSLLSDTLRGMFRVPMGRLGVIPFRKLNHSPYPPGIERGYQDCLWMAESQQEWGQYFSRMTLRMLWAARNRAEFEQASATMSVFHECSLILKSVLRKSQASDDDDYAEAQEHGGEE